jgi:hypothetical protein
VAQTKAVRGIRTNRRAAKDGAGVKGTKLRKRKVTPGVMVKKTTRPAE